MGSHLEKWPDWAERALQGLAFWIGHRHARYRDYPLSEGAIVAELCNLIHAHLGDQELLLCEEQYTSFLPKPAIESIGRRSRLDLAVVQGMTRNEVKTASPDVLSQNLVVAIEVKRATAPRGQIDYDLLRLAKLKQSAPSVRAFLFVVAESKRPKRFVAPEGRALRIDQEIPGTSAKFRVRRACKATAAFSGKETAHYACIVEVYLGTEAIEDSE